MAKPQNLKNCVEGSHLNLCRFKLQSTTFDNISKKQNGWIAVTPNLPSHDIYIDTFRISLSAKFFHQPSFTNLTSAFDNQRLAVFTLFLVQQLFNSNSVHTSPRHYNTNLVCNYKKYNDFFDQGLHFLHQIKLFCFKYSLR